MPNLINKEETERSKSEKIEEITRYVIILGQIMKINIIKKKSYNKDFKAWWEQSVRLWYEKTIAKWLLKQCSDISLRTFNLFLEKVSLNDQIGHFCVVEIEFDHTKATKRQIVYNEIYPPIIEKQKIVDPCE